jgi:hypothetical protein
MTRHCIDADDALWVALVATVCLAAIEFGRQAWRALMERWGR